MPKKKEKQLKITLVKSPISNIKVHKATVQALGLRKVSQSVVKPDNDAIRGMIFRVQHLVSVEEI